MSFSEDPRLSESFNLSENSFNTPQDDEPLKYHADQGEEEEEVSEQEEVPKRTRARALWGVLGAVAAVTALGAHKIFSAASDSADIDDGGVTREATAGEEGAVPSGDQGACDGGGDYGTGTGGVEYMPQGAPGDGGAFAGGEGGGAHFPAGTQTGAAPVPDGGASFADVGGVHIAPQTPAAPPPTATSGSAPPPNPAQ